MLQLKGKVKSYKDFCIALREAKDDFNISVGTAIFKFVNRKNPTGFGQWEFGIRGAGNSVDLAMDFPDKDIIKVNKQLPFGKAKKEVIKSAISRGLRNVVLEVLP